MSQYFSNFKRLVRHSMKQIQEQGWDQMFDIEDGSVIFSEVRERVWEPIKPQVLNQVYQQVIDQAKEHILSASP